MLFFYFVLFSMLKVLALYKFFPALASFFFISSFLHARHACFIHIFPLSGILFLHFFFFACQARLLLFIFFSHSGILFPHFSFFTCRPCLINAKYTENMNTRKTKSADPHLNPRFFIRSFLYLKFSISFQHLTSVSTTQTWIPSTQCV